jgi:hypothetical protein
LGNPVSTRAFSTSFVLLMAAGLGAACGSSYPESEYPPAPPPGVDVVAEDLSPAPPGAIWRRDLNAVLDAGLGRFLQRVDVKPEVDQGEFVGFRVVELRPISWWQGIDLAPGDVVTLVNGMPIEQPTQAHAAFESLRNANKLSVQYLRNGESRELTYSILDKPGASPATRAPMAPPPAAPGPGAPASNPPASATPAVIPPSAPGGPSAPKAPTTPATPPAKP